MDKYKLHYSSLLNLFLVINTSTNLAHSFWKNRRDAENQIKDFDTQLKKFEYNKRRDCKK